MHNFSQRTPIRVAATTLAAALLVVALPVQEVRAEEIPPPTRSMVLEHLPVAATEMAGPEDEAGSDPRAEAPGDAAIGHGPSVGNDEPRTLPDAVEEAAQGIREVSEPFDTPMPFTGLGFSGDGGQAPDVRWRAYRDDAGWSDWSQVEAVDQYDGPDEGTEEYREQVRAGDRWVSEAIWVGPSSRLQVAVEGASLDDLHIAVLDSAGLSESLPARVTRSFRSLTTSPRAAEASGLQPTIVLRSGWVDTEACTRGTISYATPRAAVLHHTATINTYTREQAPQQIRNMYHWHTSCHGINGNGWNDIGYNFIVDRFGTIYEGRRGGITNGVVGAHAGGWNTGTFGVGLMGNFNTATPGADALQSIGRLLAWKYDLHGIAAGGRTTLNGQSIPTLVGHRNVRGSYTANPSTTTDCPGQNLYTRMSSIPITSLSPERDDWHPVVGDWNGNGQTTIGWFRDGHWRLRNTNSSGAVSHSFQFGRAGDLPVTGDWNGDGKTTIGVVRGSTWLLRNSLSAGQAQVTFHYGRGGIDHPMTGDWNRDGRDTPGIVRDGEWHLRNSLSGGSGDHIFVFGRVLQGDWPVVGDWNRDGRDTPGILRDGEWHLRNSHSGGESDLVFVFGRLTRGDRPVVGDWNADGRTTVGVVRGNVWHLRNTLSGGPAQLSFSFS